MSEKYVVCVSVEQISSDSTDPFNKVTPTVFRITVSANTFEKALSLATAHLNTQEYHNKHD